MPELDPLPVRPRPPVLRPRSGDFAGVVDRARHRRRRHLGATGAGLAGAAAVFVFAASHGGGTYGLRPAPPAGVVHQFREDQAAPSESPSPDRPAASPSEAQNSGPGGPPAGGDAGDPGPAATPASGKPNVSAASATIRPVVARDDVAYDASAVCDTDPSIVTATGWCLRYDGPTDIKTGSTHTYRLLACRSVGRGAATLTFDTEQQVEFRVDSQSRTEWHWSKDYPFPKRQTSVTVGDARCARWSVVWDSVGDDGDPVAPGGYSFSPDLLASDWGIGMAMSAGTAFTFTIEE